jgi:hypothetical protein
MMNLTFFFNHLKKSKLNQQHPVVAPNPPFVFVVVVFVIYHFCYVVSSLFDNSNRMDRIISSYPPAGNLVANCLPVAIPTETVAAS